MTSHEGSPAIGTTNLEKKNTNVINEGETITSTSQTQSNVIDGARDMTTRESTKERDDPSEKQNSPRPVSQQNTDHDGDDDSSCSSDSDGSSSSSSVLSAFASSSSVSSASSLGSSGKSCSSHSSDSEVYDFEDDDDYDSEVSTPPSSPPSVIRRQRRKASHGHGYRQRHKNQHDNMETQRESSTFALKCIFVLTFLISIMMLVLQTQHLFMQQKHAYENPNANSGLSTLTGHSSKTRPSLDSNIKSTISESNTKGNRMSTTPTAEEWNGFVGEVIIVNPPDIASSSDEAALERSILTQKMFEAFQRDGVVAIRGLLQNEDLLKHLEQVSMEMVQTQTRKRAGKKGTQFHTVKHGMLFTDTLNTSAKESNTESCTSPQDGAACAAESTSPSLPFREVALSSNVAKFASELLLQMKAQEVNKSQTNQQRKTSKDPDADTVRVIRDIFLAKDDDQYICGWHVDDYGFWPTTAESLGVNAWIALDDIPVAFGGGFGLSTGSHTAAWRMDAHEAIGSPLTYPEGGFKDVKDMFERRPGGGTCNLRSVAPNLNAQLEATKRTYDLRKGDVIFASRWLFHRTIPIDRTIAAKLKSQDKKMAPVLRRYSVRYSLGSAPLHEGYSTELSVLHDSNHESKTLDQVSTPSHPWYPQCWPPSKSEASVEGLDPNSEYSLKIRPAAQEGLRQKQREMRPFLEALSSSNVERKREEVLDSLHLNKKS